MRLPLALLKCAEADIDHAVAWYGLQQPGLGQAFYSQVAHTLDAIEHFPESYQVDFGAVRRAITHRFPFAIYYRVLPDAIQVVAILDCRLDPTTARARVDTERHH
ncbi:MAG TPA: hypothetical protein VGN12_07650 [Pirellulales bacterium]|jgi:plasmid stabilization system protein ParE